MQDEAPINPLPAAVWLISLPMIALELLFNLGSAGMIGGANAIGWRNEAIDSYGIGTAYWRQQAEAGAFDFELMRRFVTFPFLHAETTHAVFAIVILLALGKYVGEAFRSIATLAIYFISGAVAALVYAYIPAIDIPPLGHYLGNARLIGAYPGDYGLIGAFTYLLWFRASDKGWQKLRAFSMIGFLWTVELVFGVLFGGSPEWIAHIVAFAAGFLMSFVAAPGGFTRLRDMIRQV